MLCRRVEHAEYEAAQEAALGALQRHVLALTGEVSALTQGVQER